MKICIIIPAYNEEARIERTLHAYLSYFDQQINADFDFKLLVVLNNCRDNTLGVVKSIQSSRLFWIDLPMGGKGYAITEGFKWALKHDAQLIGFVDADMATEPAAFHDLILQLNGYDGIIASRYKPGAQIWPKRPWIKRWGSKIFYESLVRLLFGLRYYDLQCGAKLFKRQVIERVVPYLQVTQWAFDVELLYLCRRFGFTIKEVPTVWHDQDGSKLDTFGAGMKMLATLIKLRLFYSPFQKYFKS